MSTCATLPPEFATEILIPRPTSHELWHRYHHQEEAAAENALVEEYLPLVRSVLARLAMSLPEHVDRDDLNSAGLVGLLQALRNYDPGCATSFEAYARLRIRGAMLDELRRMDWVPRTIHEKARELQAAIARLEQEHGRMPTEEEVADELGLSLEEYRETQDEIRPATFVCLDSVYSSEAGEASSLGEVIADHAERGPAEEASRKELKEIILQRLKQLPDKQRKVLALYYAEDLNLREIAVVLGVSESRVCQIHSQAIMSIRSYIAKLEARGGTKS